MFEMDVLSSCLWEIHWPLAIELDAAAERDGQLLVMASELKRSAVSLHSSPKWNRYARSRDGRNQTYFGRTPYPPLIPFIFCYTTAAESH